MLSDEEIVHELVANAVLQEPVKIKQLSGGTHVPVTLFDDGIRRVAVKRESAAENRVIAQYLKMYEQVSLLPHVVYLANNDSFLAYTYIEGSVCDVHLGAADWEQLLREVIMHARPGHTKNWGPVLTAFENLPAYLNWQCEDHDGVHALMGDQGRQQNAQDLAIIAEGLQDLPKCRLHGDLGAHNLIMANNKIVGVIDPWPVDSLPILELLFLICSKPHTYGFKGVLSICEQLDASWVPERNVLVAAYRFVLYDRINTCLRWHPEDKERYQAMYAEL